MQARFHASLRIVSNCIHEFIMQRRYVFLLSTAARPVLVMGFSTESRQSTSLKAAFSACWVTDTTFEDNQPPPRVLGYITVMCTYIHSLSKATYVVFMVYISMSMFSITSSFLCCLSSTYSTCKAWSSLNFCICIFIFSMLLAFSAFILPQLSKQIL